LISIRSALIGATSTVAVLASGPILAALPLPLNYQVLFFIAFATSLVSLYAISRLDVPDHTVASRASSGLADLADGMRRFWADRRFVQFTVATFVLHWALFVPAPLFPIYWVRTLGASDSFISVIATLGGGTSVLTALFMDRFLRRWGDLRVIGISMIGLALYPVLTGLTHTLPPLLAISIMGGVFSAGLNVCLFSAMLQAAPDGDRARFIAIYSMILNIAVFLAPLLGSWLAGLFGIVPVFFLSGVLRIFSALLYFRPTGKSS
jgi:MFS family permease